MQRYHDSRNTYKQTARYLVGEMLIMKEKDVDKLWDAIYELQLLLDARK